MVAQAKFNEKVKQVIKREESFDKNRTAVYLIVFGQFSGSMRAQLEGQDDWEDINQKNDLVKLLKSIRVWMLNQQISKSPTMSMIF